MTIDEFMRDIAPKMRPGWVVMNRQNLWWYFPDEPFLNTASLCWNKTGAKFPSILSGFDIDPVDDWTQSLRKVENNENRLYYRFSPSKDKGD